MREGGGYRERGKACESGRLQVDVAAEVQSSERHARHALKEDCISAVRQQIVTQKPGQVLRSSAYSSSVSKTLVILTGSI
jgi:hypothetical protein